jgi:hypothetical protein
MKTFFKKIAKSVEMWGPTSTFVALANPTPTSPITTVQGLVNLMCNIFGWLFYGLIALSIIMIVIAGFYYVTAGDNSEKVGKATKMILYAAVGVAVALLARAVPVIVGSFLGASGSGSNGTLQTC